MNDDARSGEQAEALRHKRKELLRVARRHFLTEGYAATRMEAVARDASVSTATLYAFFPSKTDLFGQVIAAGAADFSRLLEGVEAGVQAAGGTVRAQLIAYAEAYAGFMADPIVRGVFRLAMSESRRFQSSADSFFEEGLGKAAGVLLGVIEAHAAKGVLNVDHPSWAAGQLMGMIEHPVFYAPMAAGDEVLSRHDPGWIAAQAVDTFLARYGTGQG